MKSHSLALTFFLFSILPACAPSPEKGPVEAAPVERSTETPSEAELTTPDPIGSGGSGEATEPEPAGSFRGKIHAHRQAGTDGTVWVLRTADGREYDLLLSIPNLGREGSRDLGKVAEGVEVRVTGEDWKLGDRAQITARSLEVLD